MRRLSCVRAAAVDKAATLETARSERRRVPSAPDRGRCLTTPARSVRSCCRVVPPGHRGGGQPYGPCTSWQGERTRLQSLLWRGVTSQSSPPSRRERSAPFEVGED